MSGNFALIDETQKSKVFIFEYLTPSFKDGTDWDKLRAIHVGIDDVFFVNDGTSVVSLNGIVDFDGNFFFFGNGGIEVNGGIISG